MIKIISRINKIKNIEKIIPFLKKNKRIFLFLIIIAILIDIFFVELSSDLTVFSILLLYGFFAVIYKIKSRFTFILCLGILGAMFINYLFTGTSVSTEKAAVWLYLFLVIGIIQQWRE